MHPIQSLMDEHQTILRTLAALEALVTDAEHREEPTSTLEACVDFLRTYADRLHHGKEEALLFPALERRGLPADQGPTAAMRHEHDEGRALVRGMGEALAADPVDRDAFDAAARGFVALLRNHIAKEDHVLFPLAGRVLGGGDLHELGQAYESVESRDFPAGIHERYETWARQLAGRLGVDREHFEVHPACH